MRKSASNGSSNRLRATLHRGKAFGMTVGGATPKRWIGVKLSMAQFLAALPDRLRALPILADNGVTLCAKDGLRWREGLLVVLFQLAVALALRGATLGFPVIHIDEQFYLLVGDRMLHGAIPYVDIWDRKPIGLFLLFAAMRSLGGDGILQYQLVALASVVATALVIYRIARAHASPQAALVAGVVYQAYLSAFFCFGGQAPVYYNLLVALAGLAMLRLWMSDEQRHLLRNGLGIMALVGLAIQVKYTVVFEGVAFGLALIAYAHRLGWHRWRILGASILWCAMALAPTGLAWAAYGAIGHGEAFAQANFLSIFGRHEDFLGSLWRLTKESLALLPVGLAILWAPRHLPPATPQQATARGFLRYWAAAAVLGFLIFGTWYDHYVAPLLVPLCALAAMAFGQEKPCKRLTWFAVGFSILAAAVVTIYNTTHHGTTQEVETATAMVRKAMTRPDGTQGCLYVNEGDPVLYLKTNSCFTTRYIFPNHLNGMVDVNALGIDANAEARHILAQRPEAIVMSAVPSSLPVNWATRRMMFDALKRDYIPVGSVPVGWRYILIYKLKPQANIAIADAGARSATPVAVK